MNKVAKFEKVSKEQFISDEGTILGELSYDSIMLPKRATTGSAGYDFFLPYNLVLDPGEIVKVSTGVRCKIDDGYVLQIYPRSGLGFKYGLQLRNTVGIIDSDYYNAKNEGHIAASLINTGDKIINLNAGDAFMQGIFTPYFVTYDDEVEKLREGGMGSTGNC